VKRWLAQKLARLTTNALMSSPHNWRLFRGPMRRMFDALAPEWDSILMADHLAPYERALEALPTPPRRALDLGTGTGAGALAIARRFPQAEVLGADLADQMVEQARRKVPDELSRRVRFEIADASRLPYDDESFDLVAHANMFPFFDELDRVLALNGWTLFAFSGGAETPIYVPFDRLRRELGRRGFTDFADFAVGRGTALLARKTRGS
jgi:SAM-dependent methyltransferase